MRKLSAGLLTSDNKCKHETIEEVSASFSDHRQNMDPLVYTKYRKTADTMDFTGEYAPNEKEVFWDS